MHLIKPEMFFKKYFLIYAYLNTPWITKEIKKSSKRKQRLYERYLKIRSKENEKNLQNL